jgi:hypothetical protein
VAVDPAKNMMLIKGAVPGTDKGLIVIEQTVKRIKAKVAATEKKDKKKAGAPVAKPVKPAAAKK